MSPEDLFSRAGTIGDHAVAMMVEDGLKNTLVAVTRQYAYEFPLAIRIPANDGFGENSYAGYSVQTTLRNYALQQARYSLVAKRRTAEQQRNVLTNNIRTPTSYGMPQGIEPQWAIDPVSGLTVVIVGNGIDPKQAVVYAQRAIINTEEPQLTEAAVWPLP